MTKAADAKNWSGLLYTWVNGDQHSNPLPSFTINTWYNITPSVITPGSQNTLLAQGLAVTAGRGHILWCNTPFFTGTDDGIFSSVDWGSNWTQVGACTPSYGGATSYVECPVRIWRSQVTPSKVYCVAGVRGTNQGFYRSTDNAVNLVKPAGFVSAVSGAGIANVDTYDLAVNPTDENHILVTWHSAWGGAYGANSGILESFDGGDTWTVHAPQSTWGTGHSIEFLYSPTFSVGSSARWLLGTQSDGYWLTNNSASSWTQVMSGATRNITHGGCRSYYQSASLLYTAATPTSMVSTDNGATWSTSFPGAAWQIIGDGTGNLFSGYQAALDQLQTSTNGTTWGDFLTQTFDAGPFDAYYDEPTGIMIFSLWEDGIWLVKLH